MAGNEQQRVRPLAGVAVWLSRLGWLGYGFRRSLIKRLHPAMLRDFPFEVEFYARGSGLRYSGNIVNYVDRLVYFCGAHEKYMLRFLHDYASALRREFPGALVYLDIGANAGNHAVFMSRLADKVHAFEPFARVRAQLERNLALNGIGNVEIHPFGLGDSNAVMPFYSGPETNLGAASFHKEHKSDNHYLGDLEIRRGDDVLTAGDAVHIVKADVEGHERFALLGLRQTVQRCRPLLIVEVTQTTRDTLGSEEAFRQLFPDDYLFFHFAAGNKYSGAYRLAPYRYGMLTKIEDVIACPSEKAEMASIRKILYNK